MEIVIDGYISHPRKGIHSGTAFPQAEGGTPIDLRNVNLINNEVDNKKG